MLKHLGTAPQRRAYILLVALFALAASLPGHAAERVIDTPALDTREYRLLELPNELRVLLISEPDTDKAAVALDVNVGYYADPPGRPGLSHFLEHMLFLGTEKYPDAGSYRRFITAHGGRDNAFTGAEHTVYFFDIDKDFLDEGLDRFSQFFIAPLFNERFVGRERKAVESEYRLKIKDDARRLHQVHKETANPAHPFSRFSVGSIETLEDRKDGDIRTALIDFYREHYSANLMTAVVLGAEPLDDLERMARARFGGIGNSDRKPVRVQVPVYTDAQKQIRIDVVPLEQTHELHLEFTFPWNPEYRLTKPSRMLNHLLGHEGEGSLYALLKLNGWIDKLSAGSHRVANNEAVLNIHITLTESGLHQVDAIADLVFQYIRLIEKQGIERRVHEELKRIKALDFRFREPGNPTAEVIDLADNLHDYPARLVIRGPYYFSGYEAETTRSILGHLTPENLRMTVVAPELETDRRDPWYDTPYRVRPITDEQVRRWSRGPIHTALAIPARNIFLPEEVALKEPGPPQDKPVRLIDEDGLRVWHKQDDEFGVPKADVMINIDAPAAVDTPRHSVMTMLYLGIVDDALNAYAYPARVAGLRYKLYTTGGGLGFSVSGYDEKQHRLIDIIVDNLLGLESIDPDVFTRTFAVRKERYMKRWQNSNRRKPFRQANDELTDLLHKQQWRPETLLAHAENVTPEALMKFIPQLLSRSRVEVLVHGNLTAGEAASLGRAVGDRLLEPARPGESVPRLTVRLERGVSYLSTLEIDHEDSAVVSYYQAPSSSTMDAARTLLLGQILKTPFFNELRTERQLGYVVYAGALFTRQVPGLKLVVQSPEAGPDTVLEEIDAFLNRTGKRLADMAPEEFDRHRQGLLTLLREQDESLHQRSRRYRSNIALKHYGFDRREQLAAAVEHLEPAEVAEFFRALVAEESRGRIVVQAPGGPHRNEALSGADGFDTIVDPGGFKKSLPAFRL